MELLSKVWPQWKVVKELGEGSFGKVYEIERSDFGGVYKAALKVISIPKNASEVKDVLTEGMDMNSATKYFQGMMEEIVKEFAMMEKLKGNTNIVAYEDHEVVKHDDSIGWDILIRMELLTPLADYMMKQELAEQQIIKLGIDICKALELCKQYNIIHRDIKPENIFVSELGDYKLGDFGVARTAEKTMSGMSKKGTYTYMAPEVYKGEAYNATVDLYSLGIVLYRLANDYRTPFLPPAPEVISFSDREKAQARRMEGEDLPKPSKGSDALTAIIRKACAFNPKERYTDATQMRIALEGLLKGEVVAPTPVVEEDSLDKTVVTPVAPLEQEEKTVSMVAQPVVEQKEVHTNTKKKSKVGLFAGIGVAAVALIVGGVLLLNGGKDGDNKVLQGGDKQVSTEKDGVVQENTDKRETVDNAGNKVSKEWVTNIPEGYNILPKKFGFNEIDENWEDGFLPPNDVYIPDGADAQPHDNSMYPPISLFGQWILEDFDVYNEISHVAEGSKISWVNDGETYEFESLPLALQFFNKEDLVWEVREANDRFPEDSNWQGYFGCEATFLDVNENKKDRKLYVDEAVYDTYGDVLAIGILDEVDEKAGTADVTELQYRMEWIGWKLQLTYGEHTATYVPAFMHKAWDDEFEFDVEAAKYSEPMDNIILFRKNDFKNSDELMKVWVYSPERYYLEATMDFREDGTVTLITQEAESYDYRYPETTYEYQYRLSSYALTLISGEKESIYVIDGKWYDNMLKEFITEGDEELEEDVVEVLIENKNTILQRLKEEFAAAGIVVSIDENTGKVAMDSSILFGHDDATLSQEGKDFLDKFLGVYASVILSEECEGFVSEIEVEGHTDTSGAYDYNLLLSKDRADSVVNYCLQESNSGLDAAQLATFGNMMKTVGRSYDEPVYNADGTVNMDASRRVVFRFRLSTDV